MPKFAPALAREFADDNIRGNAIAPGNIRAQLHAVMTPEQKKLESQRIAV